MDGGVRMRRGRALRRARWLSLLAAGIVGYAIGNWHAIALRAVGLTASQSIALRFPEPSDEPSPADALPEAPLRATNAIILGDTSAVLLSPAPMIASAVQKPFIQQAPASQTPPSQGQAPIRVASAGDVALPAAAPVASAAATRRVPAAALEAKADTKVDAKPEVRTAGVAPRPEGKGEEGARPAKRRVFVLNDAQIASIKGRLHLSPDQEQMWPAVEAALRTIAYSKSRDARRRGGGATSAEVAALDPYGPEVQGLKSAAFPLIMSFSDEQRSEVRSVAHTMGLDQLASQL
jgi:hypothetical protein